MSRKPTALDTFMARKAEIDEALARLQALSDDHFNAHPDEINWGHAGSLGNIEPMPDNINAGIKPRVIQGLLTRELILANENGHAIAPLGYQAIGLEPAPKTTNAEVGVNLREGTKQARVIALLQRPEGASIEDICQETDWQKHTVRGVFSNTLKKRLGLTLTSYKNEGQPRHYRIQQGVAQ